PDPAEAVRITGYEPTRVELEAHLARPGIVVLADVYYPGWRLTIDGRPAPILRVNRMMRGAAVDAGAHTLVYTYEPGSVCRGAAGTSVGPVAPASLGLCPARQPRAGARVGIEGPP